MSRPIASWIALGLLALMAAMSLAWGSWNALSKSDDLLLRKAEVERFVRGEDPYDLPSMTYPPSALPVFTPLVAPFGPSSIKAFWLGLNLVALAVLCAAVVLLWGDHWPAWLQLGFALVVAASKPVRGGIGNGQYHLIPLALTILALLALRARRPALAGVLLAVALAKPTLVLPFLAILVATKEWKALLIALGLQGVALLGAATWIARSPVVLTREWLDTARGQLAEGMIDVPSLAGKAFPPWASWGSCIALVLLLITFGVTYRYRHRRVTSLAAFCSFMAAIFTYHRPYDLVLLVPPFASAVDDAWGRTGPARIVYRVEAALFALALIAPSHPSVTGAHERLYDGIFTALCYFFLPLAIARLVRDPRERGSGA